jgi:glycosyltransferase involved in cell wall biosynthesis
MSERLPVVSIVTPSYNYGRFIGKCLESVRGQTYPAIEHIVMDACSTDDTPQALQAHAHDGLKVVSEKDQGQADALNRGFRRATGDIVGWLNADDFYLHPRVIDEAVAALATVDVVAAGGCYVDRDGKRVRAIAVREDRAVRELRYYDTLLQPATLWRRSVHRPLRPELHYAFDWRLFLDLRDAGARFTVLPREWAAYRVHGDSKTLTDPAKRRAEVAAILGDEFGALSPQRIWAEAVHRGYEVAEARRSPALKRGIQLANTAMYYLTRRRVFSC